MTNTVNNMKPYEAVIPQLVCGMLFFHLYIVSRFSLVVVFSISVFQRFSILETLLSGFHIAFFVDQRIACSRACGQRVEMHKIFEDTEAVHGAWVKRFLPKPSGAYSC